MFGGVHFNALTRIRRPATRCLFGLLLVLAGVLTPTPASAQTGSISGYVVDTVGNRLSNATVQAVSGPSAPRQVRTGADGSYLMTRLNPGRYTFFSELDGYESDSRNFNVISGTSSRVDFTLRSEQPQGGVLQGTVLQRGSTTPISGAQIQITGGAGFPPQNTTTNSSGAYRFENLPTGRLRMAVSRDGYIDESRQLTVVEGQVRTENFSLRVRTAALARLSGLVLDEAGTPIRNARVTLVDGASAGSTDTTDSRGRYSITKIIPDTYTIEARATGFLTGGRENVVLNESASVTLNVTLAEEGSADSSIDGLVVTTQGVPIQGARVAITAGPVTGRFDVTDAQGAFLLDNLLAGTYRLTVTATGFESETRAVTLAASTALRLDFVLQENVVAGNGALTGTVTRSDNTVIVGATVRTTEGPVVGASTTTDADGEYSLSNLPEGTYSILVSRAGFSSRTVVGIEINTGETTVQDVVLGITAGQGVLSGLVTDTDGVLISGVTVSALQDDAVVASTSTNSQGRYSISGLPAGEYLVRAAKTGYTTVVAEGVSVTANRTTTQDFELDGSGSGSGTIAGLVLDPSSRAVQNALVELTGPSGDRQQRTDAEGRFEFTNLPAGSGYRVTITAEGLDPATQSNIQLASGQQVNLRFSLTQAADGGGSLAGIVRGPNGQPLGGATVAIVAGPSVGQSRITAANGRFNFTGLPGGVYTLQTSATGYRSARTSAYVRPGNGAFVIVTLRR